MNDGDVTFQAGRGRDAEFMEQCHLIPGREVATVPVAVPWVRHGQDAVAAVDVATDGPAVVYGVPAVQNFEAVHPAENIYGGHPCRSPLNSPILNTARIIGQGFSVISTGGERREKV